LHRPPVGPIEELEATWAVVGVAVGTLAFVREAEHDWAFAVNSGTWMGPWVNAWNFTRLLEVTNYITRRLSFAEAIDLTAKLHGGRVQRRVWTRATQLWRRKRRKGCRSIHGHVWNVRGHLEGWAQKWST